MKIFMKNILIDIDYIEMVKDGLIKIFA